MSPVVGATPNDFQRDCIDRIVEALARNSIPEPVFEFRKADLAYFTATVQIRGIAHDIEVYRDDVVMHRGSSTLECFTYVKHRTSETVIGEFLERLDRYLQGGPWVTPEDKGVPDLVKERVKKLFSSKK